MITRICALLICMFIWIGVFPQSTIELSACMCACIRVCVCLCSLVRVYICEFVCVCVDSPTRNCITAQMKIDGVYAILFYTHRCSSSILIQLSIETVKVYTHTFCTSTKATYLRVHVCMCVDEAAQLEPFLQTANSWNV